MANDQNKSGSTIEKLFTDATAKAAEVKKDAAEAVKAVEEKAKRYFRTVLGYRLFDHTQNKAIEYHTATEAEHTDWVKKQIAAGLVAECDENGVLLDGVKPLVAPPTGTLTKEEGETEK